MTIRHKYNESAVQAMFRSPSGGLAKTMLIRAVKVQAAAKKNLSRPPQRIDTGALRASISITPIFYRGLPAFKIGTKMKYARFVHDGTGIYGPKGQPIKPKHAQHLVFTPNGLSHVIFAKSVKGMRPNPFLKDALPAARL